MRLFLAVELDDVARRGVAAALDAVRAACGDRERAVRWAVPANLHLTLHFLGSVEAARAAMLVDRLGDRLPEVPFVASTGHVGTFPSRGPLRTIWLSIEDGQQPLIRLHHDLGRTLAAAGFRIEARDLRPHLTLGRVRDRERHLTRHLARDLTTVPVPPIRWHVGEVSLMQSDLSGPVPRYTRWHVITLAGRNH